MDQRVSPNMINDLRLGDPVATDAQDWAPPAAPLAMPKQVLERQTNWVGLAEIGRLFLLRRKV